MKNKQLKIFWSTTKTFSPDTERILGWTQTSRWNSTKKTTKSYRTKSLAMRIHLKEDLVVEIALMNKDGIITVLLLPKYASPILAQGKPNSKQRLLVDLRKINTLIANDYTKINNPVSSLSDATQHLAGKSRLCKLNCSQAYHSLQMADQRPVQKLAFSFASRNCACKSLAQGLSRSVSVFWASCVST